MTTNTNYVHVVEQTLEEKIKMYMKCTKKQLAEMLAYRDKIYEGKPLTVISLDFHKWVDLNFIKAENFEVNGFYIPLNDRSQRLTLEDLKERFVRPEYSSYIYPIK